MERGNPGGDRTIVGFHWKFLHRFGETLSNVSVTFVGSEVAFGGGRRVLTCILVDHRSTRFLLDCGATSLTALKQLGISPATINTILVTDLHGDHFGGIPFFILHAQFSKREKPLIMAGPPGLKDRVRTAMERLFPESSETKQRFQIDYLELLPETTSLVGTLLVTALPVIHSWGATRYALRVECDDRTIAYAGDSEWTDKLWRIASGADLFICEAHFFEKKIKNHLDYKTILAHKADIKCKRLVLTHMSNEMIGRVSELADEYAEDGMTITI